MQVLPNCCLLALALSYASSDMQNTEKTNTEPLKESSDTLIVSTHTGNLGGLQSDLTHNQNGTQVVQPDGDFLPAGLYNPAVAGM